MWRRRVFCGRMRITEGKFNHRDTEAQRRGKMKIQDQKDEQGRRLYAKFYLPMPLQVIGNSEKMFSKDRFEDAVFKQTENGAVWEVWAREK